MKNIFKVITFIVLGAIALTACDKDPDLPWGSFDDMEYASDFYIYNFTWSDDTINTVMPASIPDQWGNTLNITNPRGNAQSVDVYIYFSDGASVAGPFDIATGITSFPHSIAMDAETLVNAIPAYDDVFDVLAGHQYTFGLRITTEEGLTYQTNEVIGGVLRNKLSPNIRNYPGAGFAMNLRAIAVCDVDMNDLVGTWSVEEFSDRFSAADGFDVTVSLDEDGETLIIEGLVEWLVPGGSARLVFDKSNPYSWTPMFVEDHLYGIYLDENGDPLYDIRVLNNADYEGLFASCDLSITIGYEVGAYAVGGGLLGYFDWGIWTITKISDDDKLSRTTSTLERDTQIVDKN